MRQAISINTTPRVVAATLARGGPAVLPDFIVSEHVRSGRLAHLLPAWTLPSGGIHVVYPAARFRPHKVTAFVAMLSQEARREGF
jgi:DNA-binding transcriptional LysR family regulator